MSEENRKDPPNIEWVIKTGGISGLEPTESGKAQELIDFLENIKKIKGPNFVVFVNFIYNRRTTARITAETLAQAGTPIPVIQGLLNLQAEADASTIVNFASCLGVSSADIRESQQMAETLERFGQELFFGRGK